MGMPGRGLIFRSEIIRFLFHCSFCQSSRLNLNIFNWPQASDIFATHVQCQPYLKTLNFSSFFSPQVSSTGLDRRIFFDYRAQSKIDKVWDLVMKI